MNRSSNQTQRARRPRPRLKDIADAADLSVAAVSMALADHPRISDRTKQQVRRLSRQLGYQSVAGPLGRSDGKAAPLRIGLVAIGREWERAAYAVVLQAFAAQAVADPSVRIEFASVEHADTEQVRRQVLDFARGVDALVMTNFVDQPLVRAAADAGIPCVIYGHLPGPLDPLQTPVQVIAANEQAMAEAATRRLLDQGHERIAFVCEVLPRGLSHARWLAGYRLVHVERGLPLDPQLTFITGVEEQGEDRAAAIYASMALPPTAYIVPDARIAATFLAEMDRLGKPVAPASVVIHAVPQAAGVYRLDDCPMCYADPDKVARLAIRLLTQTMRQPLPFSTETIVPFDTRNW